MRRQRKELNSEFRIALVDDEQGIIDSLSVVVKRLGYGYKGFTDPLEAINAIQREHYDLLILDYLMSPIHGDEVIRRIRVFNKDIYILLLTGHKDVAPPLETIRKLDIQGYSEKSDRFDQLVLLIESGIKSVMQMQLIRSYKDGLNTLVSIAPEIYQLRPVEEILNDALEKMEKFFGCSDAFVLLDGMEDKPGCSLFCGIGEFKQPSSRLRVMQDVAIIEMLGSVRTSSEAIRSESVMVFPLLNELGQAIGVLYVLGRNSELTIRLVEMLTRQLSAAIRNTVLHQHVNQKSKELAATYEMLESMYMDTIQALRMAVDAKDVYTRGHSDRVAVYAVRLGEAFGLPKQDLEQLRLGGLFHDIGKIGTADDILFKTSGLEADEYEEVKKHPVRGANILSAISMFDGVVPIILNHHERIDGRGYPGGSKGEDIPFLSRILSVADAYDAMTTTRFYRKKISSEDAAFQLQSASGTQFDAAVVRKFVDLISKGGPEFNVIHEDEEIGSQEDRR